MLRPRACPLARKHTALIEPLWLPRAPARVAKSRRQPNTGGIVSFRGCVPQNRAAAEVFGPCRTRFSGEAVEAERVSD